MRFFKGKRTGRRLSALKRESGMTLVEMCVVIVIIGILANLAIPSFFNARKHADAARILSDIGVIRAAAFNCYAESGEFPRTGSWSNPPASMVDYLPDDFSFVYENARYRWRRWNPRRWDRRIQAGKPVLAVQVKTTDTKLLESLNGIYAGRKISTRRTIMFIIE